MNRQKISSRYTEKRSKESHHMWSAEKDDKGAVKVRRQRSEKMFDDENRDRKMSRTACAHKEAAETRQALWGLWGADLVEDSTLNSEIPVSISRRFNAADRTEASPKVYTWQDLRKAFGSDIDEARAAIANGMKVRMASQYLNVPFIIAADIVDRFENVQKAAMRRIISLIKAGRTNEAVQKYGRVAHRVANIFDEYDGQHKLAVDEKTKKYFEDYFGPYGAELVKEVKKRVKADLAHAWLRKNGVDSTAAAYWSDYFGAYGDSMTSVIPKRLSPSKSDKSDSASK